MGATDSRENCPCCSLEKGSKEVLPASDSSSTASTPSTPSTPSGPCRPPPPTFAPPPEPAPPPPELEAPLSARSSRSNFSVTTEVLAHAVPPVKDIGLKQPSDVSELKSSLKTFVQQMVRGRDVECHDGTGLKMTSCKLSKKVDAIILEPRVIPLVEISQVHRGMEALPLALQIELSPSWIVLDA